MRVRADSAPFAATALRLSAGIIVWALHFAIIYGYTGLACARRYAGSGETWIALVPWVIGIATAGALAVALIFLLPVVRSPREAGFVEWVSGWVAAFAMVAIVLEAAAVFWVPACE
jgi:hypothetical protein